MSDVIGEFLEKSGESHNEWLISDFLSLPEEVDKVYNSPTFFFSDSCWNLMIYPNGETEEESEGFIGLYLLRKDYGSPRTVSYSLGVRLANGVERILIDQSVGTFLIESGGWGAAKFLQRAELLNNEFDMAPSGVLTITCNLKNERQYSSNASLIGRLWNTSCSLKEMLSAQKGTDVVLKLRDGEVSAHKLILEARSPVFNRMFGVDMRETETGEVSVEDLDASAFRIVLNYAYSGDPEGLSTKNVCEVFRIAHKYDLDELTKLCTQLMQECLSVDIVCDVILMAEVYQEEKLKERAKEWFTNNATEVVKSEKWKTLKSENMAIIFELLECIVVENSSKKNKNLETM